MKTIHTLVLSGGGMKGIAYAGVFKYIEEIQEKKKFYKNLEINIKTLCCISVGSIIGLLHVLKYTSKEIEEEIVLKNFKTLKDIDTINLFENFGIDTGKNIMVWVESQLLKKNLNSKITFRELYIWNNIDFQIGVTNLSKQELEIHNHINTPNIPVLDSIRMSISLPFFFKSVKANNCIYVDGAVMNNYPIRLFSNLDGVLGCNLLSANKNQGELTEINTFDTYIYSLISCLWNGSISLSKEELEKTIVIQTNEKTTLNFLLNKKEKRKLILLGYSSTEKYFDNFHREY
jgi:NTE family protein